LIVEPKRSIAIILLGTLLVLSACSGGEPAPDLSAAAQEGRAVALDRGCAACHGENGEGGVGPGWLGLFGSTVDLEDGGSVLADDAYLRRAIFDPDSEVVAGSTISMPVTNLSEREVEALIVYIKEL
jgi:cytochrome c oxidase subunit 2